MQQAWLCFVVFVCALELFSSGGFSHTLVLLGVLLLKAQADYAAHQWLKVKATLLNLPSPWVKKTETNEELPPFHKPKTLEPISLEEARRRREENEKSREKTKETKNTSPPITAKQPNFSGLPHEILAIDHQSPTGQIVRAFRHWIKVYHPDHSIEQKQANEKARKIQEAKEFMLENRRKLRKSA
jgi:hypothetical protein